MPPSFLPLQPDVFGAPGAQPIAWADYDLDGDLDLFSGNTYGGINLWRNQTNNLQVSPRNITLVPSRTQQFSVSGSPGPIQWSLLRNDSGGTLSPSGYYTSGSVAGANTLDVIQALETGSGLIGRAHVHVIRPEDVSLSGKAILCAGRKELTDTVWPASNYLAQQAYRTCLLKGFDKANIQYLSPVMGIDVDGNGNTTDDIDALSTLNNLQNAINAATTASELTIYLVDHGYDDAGLGRFRLNESGEFLTAAQLDTWLDAIQTSHPVKVTVIIDSCKSGAFLHEMTPPAGKERIVITASSPTELTYFLGTGQISFSEAFWNGIFTGTTVGEAFDLAVAAINRYQTPQMDDNGDGVYDKDIDGATAGITNIGLATIGGADRPQIGQVIGNQVLTGTTSLLLWAGEIASTYAIDQVWAVIVPPTFQVDPNTNDPIVDLPTVPFSYNTGAGRWEGNYNGFDAQGTYKVIVYARDIWQSVSLPKQIYVHQTSFRESAILVVGEGAYGAFQPWENSNYVGTRAYLTFRNRWFAKSDITYLNPVTAQDLDGNSLNDDVDGLPTLANLSSAITASATANKLTLYLIGQGTPDNLHLSTGQDLTATQLGTWLDTIPSATTEVYVIIEARDSGTFADNMAPPVGRKRIVITSALPGSQSYCFSGGIFSFSHFFLSHIFEGANLRDAFNLGRPAISYLTGYTQAPGLTDNGNGILNEKTDGPFAQTRYIGPGFVTGGDDLPSIGETAGNIFLTSGQSGAVLWCKGVIDSDGITDVTATIVAPSWAGTPPVELPLTYNSANGRYEASYNSFTIPGDYRILYTAEDGEGNVGEGATAAVYQYTTADAYEIDDTTPQASLLIINQPPQDHNFHDYGDTDWAAFYAVQGIPYTITAASPSATCDPVLSLHDSTGNLIPPEIDDNGAGYAETRIWSATTSGYYYIQVRDYEPSIFGVTSTYELGAIQETGISDATAVAISSTSIQLTWTPGTGTITSYDIFRSATPPLNGFDAAYDSITAPADNYYDDNLQAGQDYYYQVKEYHGAAGQMLTTILKARTLPDGPTPDMTGLKPKDWRGYE